MGDHVCPVWAGYLLANPLRKLLQSPRKLLSGYVTAGMSVLDVGCAMGFFSLPMAEMVGSGGKVICVDLQPKMLEVLARRAARAGLGDRIETRVCGEGSLGVDDLAGRIDFVLAWTVIHEVPDAGACFRELRGTLKAGARALVAEPRGRVTDADFGATIAAAEGAGFQVVTRRVSRVERSVVLEEAP